MSTGMSAAHVATSQFGGFDTYVKGPPTVE